MGLSLGLTLAVLGASALLLKPERTEYVSPVSSQTAPESNTKLKQKTISKSEEIDMNIFDQDGLRYESEDFTKLGKKPIRTSDRPNSTVPELQRDLNEKLIQAAWDNRLEDVKSLVAEGADQNYLDAETETPYLIPTSEGYSDMLRFFISTGKPDISIHDRYGGNGTIRAAERGHAEVVALLRFLDDDVDRINKPGYTALIESIIFGTGDQRYAETVLTLVALGADLEAHQSTGTPLQEAHRLNQTAIVGILNRALKAPELTAMEAKRYLELSVEREDATGVAIALRLGAEPTVEMAKFAKNEVVRNLLQWFVEEKPEVEGSNKIKE